MLETKSQYIAYLKKLKKEEIISIIKDYNELASIFDLKPFTNLKAKKDELVNWIEETKDDYLQYLIMTLDLKDFHDLQKIFTKKIDATYVNEHKELINYLIAKKILWQKADLEVSEDIAVILRQIIKNKKVINYITRWDKIYNYVNGIIIAYGVIDRKYFDTLISNVEDKDKVLSQLNFYYKKEYTISSTRVVSNKLNNKKRINQYLKNKKYKEFKAKDFLALGNNTYHHNIKAYKKFIKMLKVNYVFKKRDIVYVDLNIVIPYLYNSLNEEEIAKNNLEETVINLFEFKGDKLKNKMLEEIMAIRNEFPLWEYRGFTKGEMHNE